MPELNTEGFVLRVFDFRETSQIAHILTPEKGNITAIAKGVRQSRPHPLIPSLLETFSQIRLALYYRSSTSMAIIKEATPVRVFTVLRRDIKRLAAAGLLFEIIDKSIPAEKEAASVCNLVEQFLTTLEHPGLYPLPICAQYLLKLVTELGYEPQVNRCVSCQKRQHIQYFNAKKGGVVCRICAKEQEENLISIDRGSLAIMRKILQTGYPELPRLRLTTQQSLNIIRIALALYRFHLISTPLKSWHFFKQTAFSELFEEKDESD
ncbi:DNA repair protein RecO [Candidatus Sumerlaeota bacterium]|nr:DNA repair protein RecO [Candidatus Sumerlaeota bacterium]